MRGEVISYRDMCSQENASLQRGMNFRVHGGHSVLLMSLRENSPYNDQIEDGGTVLIYEGHDVPKTKGVDDPKALDQPMTTHTGRPTENGKFFAAAKRYAETGKTPDLVQVYEKVKAGIWVDNGFFHLVDSWLENDGSREVFKFRLVAVEGDFQMDAAQDDSAFERERSRIIPAHIKLEVWKRDAGKCVTCGATDELHFDHILPYSKGGTSNKAENVQLLCARHNLSKSDKIM